MPLEKVIKRWGILKELQGEPTDIMQSSVRVDPGCTIDFSELQLKTDRVNEIPDTREFLVFKSKNPHTPPLVCGLSVFPVAINRTPQHFLRWVVGIVHREETF